MWSLQGVENEGSDDWECDINRGYFVNIYRIICKNYAVGFDMVNAGCIDVLPGSTG